MVFCCFCVYYRAVVACWLLRVCCLYLLYFGGFRFVVLLLFGLITYCLDLLISGVVVFVKVGDFRVGCLLVLLFAVLLC